MAILEGLENWQLNFSVEVQNEEVADILFNAIVSVIEEMGHTQWSGKMYRDLNMEKTLETFRENREAILAALPKEIVEAYYPDRVAVGEVKEVSDRPIIKMGNVIQFPKAHNPDNYESGE